MELSSINNALRICEIYEDILMDVKEQKKNDLEESLPAGAGLFVH